MRSVGEKRRVLVVFLYGLGVEVDGGRPIMLLKCLIALQLQRSGGFSIGRSHRRRTEGKLSVVAHDAQERGKRRDRR